jgi:hypothetical protein
MDALSTPALRWNRLRACIREGFCPSSWVDHTPGLVVVPSIGFVLAFLPIGIALLTSLVLALCVLVHVVYTGYEHGRTRTTERLERLFQAAAAALYPGGDHWDFVAFYVHHTPQGVEVRMDRASWLDPTARKHSRTLVDVPEWLRAGVEGWLTMDGAAFPPHQIRFNVDLERPGFQPPSAHGTMALMARVQAAMPGAPTAVQRTDAA